MYHNNWGLHQRIQDAIVCANLLRLVRSVWHRAVNQRVGRETSVRLGALRLLTGGVLVLHCQHYRFECLNPSPCNNGIALHIASEVVRQRFWMIKADLSKK